MIEEQRRVMCVVWCTGRLTGACHVLPLQPAPLCTSLQTVAVSLAAKHRRLDHALQVYRLMLQDGVQPKAPTFNARARAAATTAAAAAAAAS